MRKARDGASRDRSPPLVKTGFALPPGTPLCGYSDPCPPADGRGRHRGRVDGAGLRRRPSRRVGSLNYVSGEVAYALREEAGEPNGSDALSWTQADFNQPVCQDMSLKTGAMARARVRIGPDAIQMSSDTWLNMLNLSDQMIEASVRYGRIHLQLNKLGAGESVELEMPRGSLWVLQPGAYDIDTGTGDQPTRIVVFEGKARFVGGQADVPIAAGEEVQVTGDYPAVATAKRQAVGANSHRVDRCRSRRRAIVGAGASPTQPAASRRSAPQEATK